MLVRTEAFRSAVDAGVPGSTGLVLAGAGAAVDDGGEAWVNPGNIVASDGSKAAVNLFSVGAISDQLISSQHALSSVPDGATITGIIVRIEREVAIDTQTVVDHTVRLTKNGSTPVGDNKADTVTDWGLGDTNIDYGADDDLWGTTWTAAEVKASTFGVIFKNQKTAGSSLTTTCRVDAIWINVHYVS